MDASGISFNKEGLAKAKSNFDTIQAALVKQLNDIPAIVEEINGYWTGPTKVEAVNTDCKTANDNMDTAKATLESMQKGVGVLAENAQQVYYG